MEAIERLDRYLNNELPADEKTQLEAELRNDSELHQLLDTLQLTQRAVQLGGIRHEVRQAHADFMAHYRRDADVPEQAETGGRVIPLNSRQAQRSGALGWVVRIAASVLLLLVGYSGYRLTTTDGPALVATNYVAYQLPTTRGIEARPSPLETHYRAGDYAAAIRQAEAMPRKTPPDLFLQAMAHLRLNQYREAIRPLEEARKQNEAFVNPLFEPEIEYYLAMAYLGDNQYAQAAALLTQIRNDPQHPYRYSLAATDWWTLKLKGWAQ